MQNEDTPKETPSEDMVLKKRLMTKNLTETEETEEIVHETTEIKLIPKMSEESPTRHFRTKSSKTDDSRRNSTLSQNLSGHLYEREVIDLRQSLQERDREVEVKHKEFNVLKEQIRLLQEGKSRLETENRRMEKLLNDERKKYKEHHERKLEKYKAAFFDLKNIFFGTVDLVQGLKNEMEISMEKLR